MRHIKYDGFIPEDSWLKKSEQIKAKIIELHNKGKILERDEEITKHQSHWKDIKRQLLDLSHGKCWYSETKNDGTYMDVEHFRPKKNAKDLNENSRDAYWWLAFDYKNYRICGNKLNSKKSNYFPLKEGSLQSTFDNQLEESEEPIFLDPINMSDVQLLAFNSDGEAVPAPRINDWQKTRVEITIEKFYINHPDLVEARKKHWKDYEIKLNAYSVMKTKESEKPNPGLTRDLENTSNILKKQLNAMEQYTAVIKWCILMKKDDSNILSLLG